MLGVKNPMMALMRRGKMDIFDTRLRQIDGKREWVGLTDEEKNEAYHRIDECGECVDWVESKLKEKNT